MTDDNVDIGCNSLFVHLYFLGELRVVRSTTRPVRQATASMTILTVRAYDMGKFLLSIEQVGTKQILFSPRVPWIGKRRFDKSIKVINYLTLVRVCLFVLIVFVFLRC